MNGVVTFFYCITDFLLESHNYIGVLTRFLLNNVILCNFIAVKIAEKNCSNELFCYIYIRSRTKMK